MTTKISTLLQSQIPEYIRVEYPKFIEFLRLYYVYLEQQGMAIDILINQQSYDDIDRTLASFVPYFKQQYAELFPDVALIDKRLLVKHIKDFYLAKGSEQAFSMFFQMVYGIKIAMNYPSDRIVRASDGEWTKKIVVRVSKLTGDPLRITGQSFDMITATGVVVKTAFCESVQSFSVGAYSVYELALKVKDVNYTYLDVATATQIRCVIGTDTIIADLYTMVVDTVLLNDSYGYSEGDQGVVYGSGDGAKISVARTDLATGRITQIAIDDFGVGYTSSGSLSFVWGTNNLVWTNGSAYNLVTTISIVGAFDAAGHPITNVGVILGKLGTYPRKFAGTSGWASSDARMQDNYYYQIHSYEIKSDKSYDVWFNAVHDNAHIAGSKAFSNLSLNNVYNIN